jgi:hypothetical protein
VSKLKRKSLNSRILRAVREEDPNLCIVLQTVTRYTRLISSLLFFFLLFVSRQHDYRAVHNLHRPRQLDST